MDELARAHHEHTTSPLSELAPVGAHAVGAFHLGAFHLLENMSVFPPVGFIGRTEFPTAKREKLLGHGMFEASSVGAWRGFQLCRILSGIIWMTLSVAHGTHKSVMAFAGGKN